MAALLVAPLLASCGGGGGTDPKPSPRPATQLLLVTAPSATAQTMDALAAQPVVQVADDSGRAVAKATTVTVDVVDGNGTVVSGGSAETNASGRATFSELTLGAKSGAVGPVTLRFSAPDLTPVTSSAVELRCSVRPVTLGQSVTGSLSAGNCALSNGRLFNTYEIVTTQPVTAVRVNEQATFVANLGFRGPNQPPLFFGVGATAPNEGLTLRLLLPAGRSEVTVAGAQAGQTGTFNLNALAETSTDIDCDQPVQWTAGSITTAQRLATNIDCLEGGIYSDYLVIGIPLGATLTAKMTSTAFQPLLQLQREATGAVETTSTAPGTATLTFKDVTGVGLYILRMSSNTTGQTGNYNLELSMAHPSAATTAAPRIAGVSASRP